MNGIEILNDAAGRPAEAAHALLDALDPSTLAAHPGGHDNSVSWLLWHSGREMDAQLSDLSGEEQVWWAGGFRDRFDLGATGDEVGYGFDAARAREIEVRDGQLLVGYLEAVTAAVHRYLGTLSDADLGTVIDAAWDPPVTRGARLVSIIDDAAQHVGQAAYVVGMPDKEER